MTTVLHHHMFGQQFVYKIIRAALSLFYVTRLYGHGAGGYL